MSGLEEIQQYRTKYTDFGMFSPRLTAQLEAGMSQVL